MKPGRVLLLLLVAAAFVALLMSPLGDALTLAELKARRAELDAMVEREPVLMIGGFFLLYVAATSLSVPGAIVLTLAAGAIFGLVLGIVLVSFASTIGASLAFLGSRYLFRAWVKQRFGRRIAAIDRGIEKDGIFYLLTLRLNPAVPYFLVNLGMGLTKKKLATFYLVSQIGMLPATVVYVNAGTQLGRIRELDDVVSPALIGSLLLISLFPLLAKFVADWLRRRRVYLGWKRPKRFDRNLIVIGAGAGGLVTAYIAATVRAKVTLIEAKAMGGDCLNTGCVPSKTLIAAARRAHEVRAAGHPPPPFREAMKRVRAAIAAIAPNDGEERYRELGVDVRRGHAKLVDPWTVEIDGGERLTGRSVVIAAGGEPAVPDLPGLAGSGYLTSDTMWDALRDREAPPQRLVILGGGPIGCELAQAFARLGSAVTLVELSPRLLAREDEEAAAVVAAVLTREGVTLRTGQAAARVDGKALVLDNGEALPFDELIVAVGRKARLEGYGLDALGIDTDGTLVTDPFLRTRLPNIYAVGDVAGPYQLTHFAAHQAWYAAVNALAGVKRFRADHSIVPRVTFTDPEVAHVGHTEASAREAGIAFEVVRYGLSHLDRAVAEGATDGFVKILVSQGKDRILGATIVGAHAGEVLAEVVLAMKHGIGLKRLLGTIHAYPTMAESVKYAAGEWQKAHRPDRLLRLAERWHAWRRG